MVEDSMAEQLHLWAAPIQNTIRKLISQHSIGQQLTSLDTSKCTQNCFLFVKLSLFSLTWISLSLYISIFLSLSLSLLLFLSLSPSFSLFLPFFLSFPFSHSFSSPFLFFLPFLLSWFFTVYIMVLPRVHNEILKWV